MAGAVFFEPVTVEGHLKNAVPGKIVPIQSHYTVFFDLPPAVA
jgi:hypothetical protein